MMEITLDTMAVDAGVPDAEDLASGARPEVVVQVIGGQQLPFPHPRSGNPMRMPSVAVNFALNRDSALELAELLKTHAESLPEKKESQIIKATSLSQVEDEAQALRRIGG